jgi:hypothetical protein
MSNVATSISVLRRAIDQASLYGWLVLVLPASSSLRKTLLSLSATLVPGSCGRTLLLPNGSKLSIVDVSVSPFIPEGTPFYVCLLGWADDCISDPKDVALWRDRATGVVCL